MCINSSKNFFYLVRLLVLLGAAAAVASAERLPIKTYTIADGLPRDSIQHIGLDSHGFLWFCTLEGLSRFNGYQFTNYGMDQGLPTRMVYDLLETRSGDYWVATGKGVCRFITDAAGGQSKFELYSLDKDPKSNNVFNLIEDRTGVVWCGTEAGLYRLERIQGKWHASFFDLHQPPGNPANLYVRGLMEDRHGALWVVTGAGLYRCRPNGSTELFAEREGMLGSTLRGPILEDRDGRIWVSSTSGLHQLVPDPEPGRDVTARLWTTKDGLISNAASSLFQVSGGRLWVASNGGVSELLPDADSEGRRFRTYSTANGLSDISINTLAEDRDGNLWIGSDSGAMKLAVDGFTTYDEEESLKTARIVELFFDRAGEFCTISNSGDKIFINSLNGPRFSATRLVAPNGITYWGWGWYQTILQDHAGEWWMPMGEGLVRYPRLDRPEELTHERPKAIYTTRDGLPANDIFRIFEDSRGDIWISTLGNSRASLARWKRSDESFHTFSLTGTDNEPPPTAFAEDAAGNIWIGLYTGGLARYSAGRFRIFGEADGLPKGFIKALYFDARGRLWIGTGEGGAACLDNPQDEHPKLTVYNTVQGLSSNEVTCITEDRWGRIYLGTGSGLDRLEPDTGHIKHYTTADGLIANFVNLSLRDRDGSLWFGTLRGLSRLIPQPDRPTTPPPIFISGVRIAGTPAPLSELGATVVAVPDLQESRNNLDIDFFGLSFGPGEVLNYQYLLDGSDRDWSRPTQQRTITFANLRPGSYRFLVRAVGADGSISQTPASVTFRILPPLWQRWWFLTLAGLLLCAIIYFADRYRIKRIIDLERVRTRIAADLHDDIGSGLTRIAILSEIAGYKMSQGSGEVTEPLSMIASASRELVDSMSDIVWAINPNKDRLQDLTQRMREFAGDVFTARNIEFQFHSPSLEQDLKIGTDARRQIFLIFKEAVNNIARHSCCTQAEIEFRVEKGWALLRVSDNGKGLDSKRATNGNGLINMRLRAEKMGGDLQVASNNGNGTTLVLKAPLAFSLKQKERFAR